MYFQKLFINLASQMSNSKVNILFYFVFFQYYSLLGSGHLRPLAFDYDPTS